MPRYPTRTLENSSAQAGGVAAVDRAMMLLMTFDHDNQTLSLTELSARTKIVKSTVLRLLASLQHFSLIQRLENGSYTPGIGVARLYGVYTSTFSLENEVMPVLQDLLRKTNETAVFYVKQGDYRLALYRVESAQPIQSRVKVGDLVPIGRGSGGRVLAAFTGAKGSLYEKIRKEKVAALIGDRVPDMAGIAAPAFGPKGVLAGAVTLTMPSHRFKKNHIQLVSRAAQTLSARLNGTKNVG